MQCIILTYEPAKVLPKQTEDFIYAGTPYKLLMACNATTVTNTGKNYVLTVRMYETQV